MKRTRFSATLLAAAFIAAGCGGAGKFGNPITTTTETALTDVLNEPTSFQGKVVKVRGQIATVDNDGKGFNLDNGRSRLLYVLCAADFKIAPTARYHLASAEGVVVVDKEGVPTLRATGVVVE